MKKVDLPKRLAALIVFIAFTISGQLQAQKLVLPGDYPDPSVVKIGDTYWASATSSNWFPAYPLLYSKDLVNWKQKGYVFDKKPSWADYYFWAPEISYENGKVYMYYSAHKKGGNLCLAVATADRPEGPYTDLGPIMCEAAGSIDAFAMRDENGKLFMIWKEDGNSVRAPTPIWAMEMKEDRTGLIGEKKELFRNKETWEGNLVEGVSMMRHGEYFYAFYAAAGCCGAGCTYLSGVARSKKLMGPWEKYEKNPLLVNGDKWICPGHGTPVERDGRFYFLYHGYDKQTNAFTGREGLLHEFTFTPDGWIKFLDEPQGSVDIPKKITEKFKGSRLTDDWQWNVFDTINTNVTKGRVELSALPSASGAFLGRKTLSGNYTATVVVKTWETIANAGLAALGDDKNTLSVQYNGSKLMVVEIKNDVTTVLDEVMITAGKNLYLRANATQGKYYNFMYSSDGKNFKQINSKSVDGTYLPPWDRAVRIGIVSKGSRDQKAVFDDFILQND